jgi:peroxiredoxin
MPIMAQDLNLSTTAADAAVEVTVAAASGAAAHALRAGARVPSFVLPDKQGNQIALDRLLASGPVVLNFLRGSWCSFGEESLVQFAAMHERIATLGAKAVAIAPPDGSASQHVQLPISVPQLVDTDMRVIRAFGLAFDLPEELHARYLEFGYLPPRLGRDGKFLVPIPATYLIDETGIVVFVHVDLDYRKGFDGESLLTALRALRGRRALHDRQVSPLAAIKHHPGRTR